MVSKVKEARTFIKLKGYKPKKHEEPKEQDRLRGSQQERETHDNNRTDKVTKRRTG